MKALLDRFFIMLFAAFVVLMIVAALAQAFALFLIAYGVA